MISGQDIIDFVLKYRRGKAYKNFSEADIITTVSESADLNGLGMVTHLGKLSALAITFPWISSNGDKLLHIHSILTTRPGDLQTLLTIYHSRFPAHTITARRHGRFVKYNNTAKLIRRLWTKDRAHKREWQTS